MKIGIKNELLLLNLLAFLLIIVIVFLPSNVLRIILGLPFVLFFPGYVLMAAFFVKKEEPSILERVVLSFGLSIAVVPLIGLILNYMPWGIKLESILYSVASFVFIMSVIAWLRRRKLVEEERFSIRFHLRLPGWGGSAWDKVLSIILVLAILGALGVTGYVIATPKVAERYTQFYILGPEGKAASYPRDLKVGKESRIMVCIVNHEYEAVSYRVEARINGVKNNEIEPIVLEHNEKWEGEISFVADVAGENQKVEFLLYKNEEAEPCLEPLRLWINVAE